MTIKTTLLASGFVLASFAAHAGSDTWETISNVGTNGLIATALLVPAVNEDWDGLYQAGFSIGAAAATSVVTKQLVHEERPDHSDNQSFPSNHASAAFAAATTLTIRNGWQWGIPAYGVATLSAVGRVEADRHYWKDVIAGAAIGTAAGWFFTHNITDTVAISPWFDKWGTSGIMVSMRW
ncbi:phosphatase PAP2 family protein [Gallaecimonas mangrovi]|uniref:phosphatase PAP2 family protein n=1 Tax=Gallaecimonas mangrovi TaxID=2291597 RepID=UPI000E2090FB|nr:phosphatase PAP2 family protein [Gallaecimonas mangrovi]